jgi:hypothetical protein
MSQAASPLTMRVKLGVVPVIDSFNRTKRSQPLKILCCWPTAVAAVNVPIEVQPLTPSCEVSIQVEADLRAVTELHCRPSCRRCHDAGGHHEFFGIGKRAVLHAVAHDSNLCTVCVWMVWRERRQQLCDVSRYRDAQETKLDPEDSDCLERH